MPWRYETLLPTVGRTRRGGNPEKVALWRWDGDRGMHLYSHLCGLKADQVRLIKRGHWNAFLMSECIPYTGYYPGQRKLPGKIGARANPDTGLPYNRMCGPKVDGGASSNLPPISTAQP